MRCSFLQNNRLLWAILLVLGLAVGVQAQSLVNTAHVVDSAGGASESASYSNISAIGQPFGFNENSSATYVNQGGFLNGGSLIDSDNDGLTYSDETNIHKTDPNNPDTDGDGLTDFEEILILITDPKDADSDNDGYEDRIELTNDSDPNKSGSTPEAYLSNGLVTYYKCNALGRNGGVPDASEYGIHGESAAVSLTSDRFNQPSSAYKFRSGYISAKTKSGKLPAIKFSVFGRPAPHNDADDFVFNGSFSVSMWVKKTRRQNAEPWMLSQGGILWGLRTGSNFDKEKGTTSERNGATIGVSYEWKNGILFYDNWKLGGENMRITIDKEIKNDEWQHMVFTMSYKNAAAYIDGKLIQKKTDSHVELNEHYLEFFIGRNNNGANPLKGASIDDIRIYNRVLTLGEVRDLYGYESGGVVGLDTDGDGLSDEDEVSKYKTDPNASDTDSDYLPDGNEVHIHGTNPLLADTDGDGTNDGRELADGTDPNKADAIVDTDSDGLTDSDETNIHKTNPALADTDSDGLTDGDEVNKYKTNPLLADTDADGLTDGDEVNKYGTDPLDADSDDDSFNDGDEVAAGTDPKDSNSSPIVDTDKDGLTDLDEINIHKTNPNLADTDQDGLTDGDEVSIHNTNPNDPDTDRDGLPDGIEVNVLNLSPILVDSDEDGVNDGDEDFDSDGLTNLEEIVTYKTNPASADSDLDGLSDYIEIVILDLGPLYGDTDLDGINDGDEDFDSDGLTNLEEIDTYKTNPAVADTDEDGLNDGDEVNILKTDPLLADTDGDGLSDGMEVLVLDMPPLIADSDGNGISDGDEDSDSDGLSNVDEVNKYKTHPLKPDTDGDGLNDWDEVIVLGTDPRDKDTDRDGIEDADEDTDFDGLTDGSELNRYKTNPLLADTDGDGLTDGDEVNKYKTNPRLADTDGDGLSDGDEVNIYKTNPLVADTDGDGLSDGLEVKRHKTDPLLVDTDEDESTDGEEVAAGTDANDPDDFPINVVAPVITASPDPVFAKYGDNVMFKVEARGVPIAYQWFKNGKPIDGAKANLLRLYDVGDDDIAVYTVEVSNQAGKVVSFPAVLKIVKAPPVFSEIPTRFDLVYEAGETIILDPKIKTDGPTTYQWDKDGNDLPNETDPILIIHDVKDEDAGDYTVDATNLAGTTVSETMRVAVVDESKIGLHVENNFQQTLGIIDSSPAVGQDGTVYYSTIGELGSLYAHQPNGVRKWVKSFDSPLRGSPAIDGNGIVYVLEDAGALHAVSPAGKKLWQYELPVEFGDEPSEYHNSPAITEDNTVIFGWIDGTVYAVKDGQLIWKFTIEEPFYSSPSIGPDGTVYIGSSTGDLYAINPANGEPVWGKPFSSGGEMHTRPAIDANGDIYFGSYSGMFYALNPDRGVKWFFDTEQDIWSSAVIRGDGTVYFGGDDGKFYALDTETGLPKWEYKINTNFQKSTSAALGLDGSIYFSLTDNKFYAISRIGKEVWSVRLKPDEDDSASYSSPALLDDGKIFVGAQDGNSKGQLNVIQGGSPIDNESPWPSFGGDLQNTGRVMVKRTDADSFKAELRVIEASGENVKIQVTGDAFETYKLQYSNDLKTWKLVPELQSITTNFRGKADFNRTPTPDSGPVFYRLMNE